MINISLSSLSPVQPVNPVEAATAAPESSSSVLPSIIPEQFLESFANFDQPRALNPLEAAETTKFEDLKKAIEFSNRLTKKSLTKQDYSKTVRCFIIDRLKTVGIQPKHLQSLVTKMSQSDKTSKSLCDFIKNEWLTTAEKEEYEKELKEISLSKLSETIEGLLSHPEFLDVSVATVLKQAKVSIAYEDEIALLMQNLCMLPETGVSVREGFAIAFLNWLSLQQNLSAETTALLLQREKTAKIDSLSGLDKQQGLSAQQNKTIEQFRKAYEIICTHYEYAPLDIFLDGRQPKMLTKSQLMVSYQALWKKALLHVMKDLKDACRSFDDWLDNSTELTYEKVTDDIKKSKKSRAGQTIQKLSKKQCEKVVREHYASVIVGQQDYSRSVSYLDKMNCIREAPLLNIMDSINENPAVVYYMFQNYFKWIHKILQPLANKTQAINNGKKLTLLAKQNGNLGIILEKNKLKPMENTINYSEGVLKTEVNFWDELTSNINGVVQLAEHFSEQMQLFRATIEKTDEKKGNEDAVQDMAYLAAEWQDEAPEATVRLQPSKAVSQAEKRKRQKAKKAEQAKKEKKGTQVDSTESAPPVTVQVTKESMIEAQMRKYSAQLENHLESLSASIAALEAGNKAELPKILQSMNAYMALFSERVGRSLSTAYQDVALPHYRDECIDEIRDHFLLVSQGIGLFLQSLHEGNWQQLELCAQTFLLDLHVILEQRIKLSILKHKKADLENPGKSKKVLNALDQFHKLLGLAEMAEPDLLRNHRALLKTHHATTFWTRYTQLSIDRSGNASLPMLLKDLTKLGQMKPKDYLSQAETLQTVTQHLLCFKDVMEFLVTPEVIEESQVNVFIGFIERLKLYSVRSVGEVLPYATKQSKEVTQLHEMINDLNAAEMECHLLKKRANGDNPIPAIREMIFCLNRLKQAFHMMDNPRYNTPENQFWLQRNLVNMDKVFKHVLDAVGRLTDQGPIYCHRVAESIEFLQQGTEKWTISARDQQIVFSINVGNTFHYLHRFAPDPSDPKKPLILQTTLGTLFKYSKGKVKNADQEGFTVQDSEAITAGNFLKDAVNLMKQALPALDNQMKQLIALMRNVQANALNAERAKALTGAAKKS